MNHSAWYVHSVNIQERQISLIYSLEVNIGPKNYDIQAFLLKLSCLSDIQVKPAKGPIIARNEPSLSSALYKFSSLVPPFCSSGKSLTWPSTSLLLHLYWQFLGSPPRQLSTPSRPQLENRTRLLGFYSLLWRVDYMRWIALIWFSDSGFFSK